MPSLSKAIAAGIMAGFLGLLLIPFTLGLEQDIGLAILFKLRGERKAPEEVVIVAADKESSERLDLPSRPENGWPRSLHARLVEKLVDMGAAVIVFDLFFEGGQIPEEEDNRFAAAMQKAGNVVLCACLEPKTLSLDSKNEMQLGKVHIYKHHRPYPLFEESALVAAPFPLPKVPVKVSQYWLIKKEVNRPTLPVVVFQVLALGIYDDFIQLLKKAAPSQASQLPESKKEIIETKKITELILILRSVFKNNADIAEKMILELNDPANRYANAATLKMITSLIRMYQSGDCRHLNFYGPPGSIRTISYHQFFGPRNTFSDGDRSFDLQGKTVFIGLSERFQPVENDYHHTVFSRANGIDLTGVEIAATAFANLLEDAHVRPIGVGMHLMVVFLWGMAVGILFLLFSPAISVLTVAALSIFFITAAQNLFNHSAVWIPLVVPLGFQNALAFLGTFLWKHYDISRQKKIIGKALGYYIPSKEVDHILKNKADMKASGRVVYGTCISTDAVKSTRLSEVMTLKDFNQFMNRYYEIIFEPVKRHGGYVQDYVGDSMLAVWADVQPEKCLNNQACLAALDISEIMNRSNAPDNAFTIPTRIGMNSGWMELGNIGAHDRYEYRAVSEVVVTAKHLEALNKELGTWLLVSDHVFQQLDGYLARRMGTFRLPKKTKPVIVYELICLIKDSTEQQRNRCTMFEEALKKFYARSWEEAKKTFYECMNTNAGDGPSLYYIEKCNNLVENPPSEEWDGTIIIESK
ncbi:MAG: adenylate/guanylate cyclase domain-containing protein [Desulfobacterales bacterium]